MTPSIIRMKIWPPSRMGIGSRFMMAMLMLMKPIRWSRYLKPAPRRLAALHGDLDRAGERALGRDLAAEDLAQDAEGLAHDLHVVAHALDHRPARRVALEEADARRRSGRCRRRPRGITGEGQRLAVAADLDLDPLAGPLLDVGHEVAWLSAIGRPSTARISSPDPEAGRRGGAVRQDLGDLRPHGGVRCRPSRRCRTWGLAGGDDGRRTACRRARRSRPDRASPAR